MKSIPQNKRYLPHEMTTRKHAVELYRRQGDVAYICRNYHISKASLMRWNRRYDGTPQSLMDRSHRPHTPHPNAHTAEEEQWIVNYYRRTPTISLCELYGKLVKEKQYTRHPASLYRVVCRLGLRKKVPSTKEKSRHTGHYETPQTLGMKWQMDVKYVPRACYVGEDGQKFYQYTMIDEASRERFIYPYLEQSSYSTVDFVLRAIRYFRYKPMIIQTDNGSEFTHFMKTGRIHPLDHLCRKLNIEHKLIRPRTPWHNGKVERSHRSDQERFYNHLKFYSFSDLHKQMERYLLPYQPHSDVRAALGISH